MLHKQGLALARLGRTDAAIELHRRGLATREQLLGSDDLEIVKSLLPLAAAREAAGELHEALADATRAEAIAAAHDDWRLLALALQCRGRIEHSLGDDEAARASLGGAIELFDANEEPASAGAVALELAILEHDAGDLRAAVAAYERALAGAASRVPLETHELAVVLALAPDAHPSPAAIARDLARARLSSAGSGRRSSTAPRP
jgi:tetratricopeptide (TPR) repeat protein